MSIYPWNRVGTNGGPFVLTPAYGVTFAASILNCGIDHRFPLSTPMCLKVGRMLHGMAEQGSARIFAKRTPWYSVGHCVLVMTIALLFAVYLNYIMPENVFTVIASLATFATVWVA